MKKFEREELINTYIKSGNTKLTECYLEALISVGLHALKRVSTDNYLDIISCADYPFISTSCSSIIEVAQFCEFPKEGFRELTLTDFEDVPEQDKGQVSQYRYEEIEVESIFHMQEALNNGSLVFGDQKKPVQNEWSLMKLLVEDKYKIYLKEEIKWQDEVLDYLCGQDTMPLSYYLINQPEEFLEVARTALRAIGELK